MNEKKLTAADEADDEGWKELAAYWLEEEEWRQ